jgi:hypothetical protein
MTRDKLNQIEHIGFAFYGFSPSAYPIAKMYQWALDWFNRFGCVPDLAGANIGGKSDGNYKSFRNLDRKVRACDFAGVTDFTFVDIPDEFVRDENEWDKAQYMDVAYRTGSSKYFVCCIREDLIRNRMDEFLETAKQACEILRPQYGIVYRRPFGNGPLAYGISLQYGNIVHRFDESMCYWATLRNYEVFTFLRDIYPWSVLTKTQLDIKVGDVRLEDWIQAKTSRGQLSRFTDQMTLWTVSDEAISQLRDELWKAGVIFDRKRDVEDVMDEYNVSEREVVESIKSGIPLVHRLPGPGISEEEMLRDVLGAFGGPDSQVLRVEGPGKLRELSEDDLNEVKKKPKPKSRGGKQL